MLGRSSAAVCCGVPGDGAAPAGVPRRHVRQELPRSLAARGGVPWEARLRSGSWGGPVPLCYQSSDRELNPGSVGGKGGRAVQGGSVGGVEDSVLLF